MQAVNLGAYVIWGKHDTFAKRSKEERLVDDFWGAIRYKLDKYGKFRFADEDIFYIYSGTNTLEEVNGTLLNEAIDLFGYGYFTNITDSRVLYHHKDLIIQTDILGVIFRESTKELYVAYSGVIYKQKGISAVTCISLDDILTIGYVDATTHCVRMLCIDGYDEVSEGNYKGNAGVALCKFVL